MAKTYTEQLPKKETLASQQAYNDWYLLGPGRSLSQLLELYKNYPNGVPPTTHLHVLKQWSSAHHWVDRAIAQQQKEADTALAEAEAERRKHKQAKIAEGRGLRQIGGQVVTRIIQRIKAGELDEIPLVGRMVYPEKGRPYRVDGLLDILPDARKAIEIGQLIENREMGEGDDRFLQLFERCLADLPAHEQAFVRAVAFRSAKELDAET